MRLTDIGAFIIHIYDPTEIVVVDFVEVSLISEPFQDKVQRFRVRKQVELVQDTKELILGDVSLFGDVEVFKVGFDQHSFVLDRYPVFQENVVQLSLFLLGHSKIVTPGWKGCGFIKLGDLTKRILIDSLEGEDGIDTLTELIVVHMSIWYVVYLIVVDQDVDFLLTEVEIINMQDSLELSLCHNAFSEGIIILKEFSNTDSFHHYLPLDFLLHLIERVDLIMKLLLCEQC